ncbi:MAG: ATP-binding protein, partial [Vicinamibacteraceae bacterium]
MEAPRYLRSAAEEPLARGKMALIGGPRQVAEDEAEHRLWQRDRLSRVVREDLRDLERVREISLVEQLVDLLPERVGAPLSIANLRQDLEVDHKTVERWLQILENLYVCFRVAPYGVPRIRAVKKERKAYLWDWSSVPGSGARFENLVASQLLKYCHFIEDTEGRVMELRYLRDVDKREVDFVVLQNRRPLFAVECKTGDRAIGPAVRYFAERTPIPRFYQVHRADRHFSSGKVTVIPVRPLLHRAQHAVSRHQVDGDSRRASSRSSTCYSRAAQPMT